MLSWVRYSTGRGNVGLGYVQHRKRKRWAGLRTAQEEETLGWVMYSTGRGNVELG